MSPASSRRSFLGFSLSLSRSRHASTSGVHNMFTGRCVLGYVGPHGVPYESEMVSNSLQCNMHEIPRIRNNDMSMKQTPPKTFSVLSFFFTLKLALRINREHDTTLWPIPPCKVISNVLGRSTNSLECFLNCACKQPFFMHHGGRQGPSGHIGMYKATWHAYSWGICLGSNMFGCSVANPVLVWPYIWTYIFASFKYFEKVF